MLIQEHITLYHSAISTIKWNHALDDHVFLCFIVHLKCLCWEIHQTKDRLFTRSLVSLQTLLCFSNDFRNISFPLSVPQQCASSSLYRALDILSRARLTVWRTFSWASTVSVPYTGISDNCSVLIMKLTAYNFILINRHHTVIALWHYWIRGFDFYECTFPTEVHILSFHLSDQFRLDAMWLK